MTIQQYDTNQDILENVIIRGDISGLTPKQRSAYYLQVCESLGLNPKTQPFAMLKLNGKDLLYATKNCTDQLTAMHKLTRKTLEYPKEVEFGSLRVIRCVVEVSTPNGRVEHATGAVPTPTTADALCNALMKCETKAKRRATLSIVGLGCLDESELDTLPAEAVATVQQIPIDNEHTKCVSGTFEGQPTPQLDAPSEHLSLEQAKTESVTVPPQQATQEQPKTETPKTEAKKPSKSELLTKEYIDAQFAKAKEFLRIEREVTQDIVELDQEFSRLCSEEPRPHSKADLQVMVTAARLLDALTRAKTKRDVIAAVVLHRSHIERWAKAWTPYKQELFTNAVQAYGTMINRPEADARKLLMEEIKRYGDSPIAANATLEEAKTQWTAYLAQKKEARDIVGAFGKYCTSWLPEHLTPLQDITEQRLVNLGLETEEALSFVYNAYQKATNKS